MMGLPGHLLYIIYYNGRLQRYHSLFIPYKEDISFLHYKACVEWGEGPGPSQNRSWKRNKRKGKTALPFMGSFGFPHLSICNSSSSAPSPHSFLSSGSRGRSMAKQCLGEALWVPSFTLQLEGTEHPFWFSLPVPAWCLGSRKPREQQMWTANNHCPMQPSQCGHFLQTFKKQMLLIFCKHLQRIEKGWILLPSASPPPLSRRP